MGRNRWIGASAATLLAAVAFCPRAVSAAVLASENFEGYSLGDMNGQPGDGIGWNGVWHISAETGSLNQVANTTPLIPGSNQYYTGTGSKNGLYSVRFFDVSSTGPFTSYTSDHNAANQGTLWASMLVRSKFATGSQASYTDWIGFKNGLFSNAAGVTSAFMLAPAKTGNVWSVMVDDGNSNYSYHSTTVPLVVGQTEKAVFKFDFDTDTASVYFNPTSASDTPAFSYTFTNAAGLQLTSVWTQYKFPDVDNILVGESFSDVIGIAVPEPASLGLLALGGLSVLRRRR